MKVLDLALNPRKAIQRYSPFRTDLREGQENELQFLFTKRASKSLEVRASHDPVVRAVYSSDATPIAPNLSRLVKTEAGAVVLPLDRGELVKLLKFAQGNNVPLTPRGGGTSAHGGAVPAEGGVVVDMRLVNGIVDLSPEAETVTVRAGTTWFDLAEALAEHGLAPRQMPTNAVLGTVGGFVARGTGGFGSFEHGPVRESIVEATVLHPDGSLKAYSGDGLDLVVGALGTTGFIVDVTLKVSNAVDVTPLGAAFDGIHQAAELVRKLRGQAGVHSVHIVGPDMAALVQEAAGVMRALPKGKVIVVVAAHAGQADAVAGTVGSVAEAFNGEALTEDQANWAWDHRFHNTNFSRFGPTLVTAEAVAPLDGLERAWVGGLEALSDDEEARAMWAVATSKDEVLLIGHRLADVRMPNYSISSGAPFEFVHRVKKAGGRPAVAGLFEAPHAAAVLGKGPVKRIAKWKREHDPQEIMNPGKVIQARVRGLPPLRLGAAMAPGRPVMAGLSGTYEHRRPERQDPGLRALASVRGGVLSPRLARLADLIFGCSPSDSVDRVGGLHREGRFVTQLPSGVLRAGQAILQGEVPGPDVRDQVHSLPCVPSYDAASVAGLPVFDAILGVREACVRAAGPGPATKAVLRNVEANGHPLPKGSRSDWLPGAPPAGEETGLWLLAGDSALVNHDAAAKAAFAVLANAGVSFRAFNDDEPSSLTQHVRVGAWDAASETFADTLTILDKTFKGRLPDRVITLSSEDAVNLRRAWPDLAADHDAVFDADVESFAEAALRLVKEGRLSFGDGGAPADETDDEADAGTDEGGADDADAAAEAPPANPGTERFVYVASPFAAEGEADAAIEILSQVPGVHVELFDADGLLIPDVGFLITHPDDAAEYVGAVAAALKERHGDSQVIASCTDLATVLAAGKVKATLLPELVAAHMVQRGGGAVAAAPVEAEEEGTKEFDIPEGAHRVELVKENAVIPVFPDQSILDAAEALGFEMPFDCRSGSCVTCCGKFEGAAPDQSEGQVLSADEQKNYCLTCIAKPTGNVKIWSDEAP